jgi:hypothetical protein
VDVAYQAAGVAAKAKTQQERACRAEKLAKPTLQ